VTEVDYQLCVLSVLYYFGVNRVYIGFSSLVSISTGACASKSWHELLLPSRSNNPQNSNRFSLWTINSIPTQLESDKCDLAPAKSYSCEIEEWDYSSYRIWGVGMQFYYSGVMSQQTVELWQQWFRRWSEHRFSRYSDKAPTNKIYRRASSEQRPRTRSCHESERLV